MNSVTQSLDITVALQLARNLYEAGEVKQSVPICGQILSVDPDNTDALHLLALIAHQMGKNEQAARLIEKAIGINRTVFLYHYTAGSIYHQLNMPDFAIACYNRSIALKPDFHGAHNNLGVVLTEQGKLDAAVAHYKRAIALNPGFHGAHNNLGVALAEQGKLEEAAAHYSRAIALKADYYEAYSNLGNVLNKLGRFEEAKSSYRKALELKPNDGIKIKLATLLPVIMPSGDSIPDYRRQIDEALDDFLQSGVVLNDPFMEVGQTNFYLAYHGLNNRDLQVKTAKLYLNACPSLLFVSPHCRKWKGAAKPGKIKVGFISSNFYNIAIGKHFRGVIANLSRELFEVYVFFGKKRSDGIARFIEENADVPVTLVPALEAARRQIARCGLDILFYADIGMDPLTYFLAFSRLAPVQCVTWGHPDTTGIPNMDYYISCEDFEAEGSETQYSESLVRMKNIPNYFYRPDSVRLTDSVLIRERMGLRNENRLYVVPQSLFKFHPDFDAVLGEILRRDSNGLLILFEATQRPLHTLLMDRFRESIPDVADRIVFLPRLSFDDFLSFIRDADAVLDTPYFCGGTTSLEIFSVGCPIVTWPGSRMASRFTYAYYKKMDIMDLVCSDSEQYIQRAVRLANDAGWRKEISGRILERNDIFYDNQDSVRELEQFLLSVSAISG